MKKVDEEENDIAKGAVIPEKYKFKMLCEFFPAMDKVPGHRQTDHGVWSNKSSSNSSRESMLSRESRH